MQFWIIQTLNSVALGALLFLLSSGFSLIFGLMRVANLAHGAFFMLGAYVGLSALRAGLGFFWAVLIGGVAIAFIIADASLIVWSGDPMPLPIPEALTGAVRVSGIFFPKYRLAVVAISVA